MKKQIINEFIEWLKSESLSITNMLSTTIVAVYIRVSTNKQEELSPLSQLKEVYKYCKKNNLQIDLNYIFVEEEGISGKKADNRNEFQNMIALAKSKEHPFNSIVVWKFSRFARNQEESIVYKNMLKKNDVNVISISEPVIDGPFGSLIERIIEWMDEYYLINLSGEVKRGMTEGANKGRPQTYAPFGYRNKDKQYVINEEEAEIVKYIFDTFVNTDTPQIEIARHINKLGFKTKRGAQFENRTITYILLNPVYIGKIRWTPTGKLAREEMYDNTKSIIVDGQHEPIISEELFNKAKEKLNENRKWRIPHEKPTSTPWHWLKGLIRCECGKTFVRNNDRLRCNGANKGTCSVGDRIDPVEVEELVLKQVKADFTSKTKIDNIIKSKPKKEDNRKTIVLSALQNLDKKGQRIKDAYLNGIDTLEEYKINKQLIEKEKSELEYELEKINKSNINEKQQDDKTIKEHLKSVYELLIDDKIDMSEKYKIAHKTINCITYKNGVLYLKYNKF